MLPSGPLHRWTPSCPTRGLANIGDATSAGQILQIGLKPLDLPVQLLGLAAKLHPFQFVDLGVDLIHRDITLGKLGTGLDQQGLERINVIRKLGGSIRHARSLRARQSVHNTDSTSLRRGCRQSMPSSNIDSCDLAANADPIKRVRVPGEGRVEEGRPVLQAGNAVSSS